MAWSIENVTQAEKKLNNIKLLYFAYLVIMPILLLMAGSSGYYTALGWVLYVTLAVIYGIGIFALLKTKSRIVAWIILVIAIIALASKGIFPILFLFCAIDCIRATNFIHKND